MTRLIYFKWSLSKMEGGEMDLRTIEQVRNDLVEMAQELLLYAHISNVAAIEGHIHKFVQRLKINIGLLSRVIEENKPQQPKGKHKGPFGWLLDRI